MTTELGINSGRGVLQTTDTHGLGLRRQADLDSHLPPAMCSLSLGFLIHKMGITERALKVMKSITRWYLESPWPCLAQARTSGNRTPGGLALTHPTIPQKRRHRFTVDKGAEFSRLSPRRPDS